MSQDFDIRYVAELARLELPANELEKLQGDLNNIVGYIAELSEVDVSNVEPTAHAAKITNAWRQDEVKSSYPREVMLANAPDTVDGELIKVPQVLPGEGSN